MNQKLRKIYLPLFGFAALFQLVSSFLKITLSQLPFVPYLGFATSVLWGIAIVIGIVIIVLERNK